RARPRRREGVVSSHASQLSLSGTAPQGPPSGIPVRGRNIAEMSAPVAMVWQVGLRPHAARRGRAGKDCVVRITPAMLAQTYEGECRMTQAATEAPLKSSHVKVIAASSLGTV